MSVHRSIHISFLDDNSSKHQWIFTKLGMCIDIVEIWLGLLMCKLRQILTELPARDTPIFSFPDDNLCKCQGILTNLVHALILRKSGLGLLMRKFRQCLTEFSALDKIIAGYYCLTFLCRTMFQDFAQPDNGSKETRKIWMILCVQLSFSSR